MSPPPLVLVLNGPNLDRLGSREPEIYGSTTLPELEDAMRAQAEAEGLAVEFLQTDSEDALIEAVRDAPGRASAIIINPAAFTHFSYPLRDALAACGLPVIEVHVSNIHAREPFRRLSVISAVVRGVVCGLGTAGYTLALEAVAGLVRPEAAKGGSGSPPAKGGSGHE